MPGRSCALLAWLSLTLLVGALGVASLGLGDLIKAYPYSAPYEDLKLKAK